MTREEQIVEAAKAKEEETGFGELVKSHVSRGVNSAYGIGFLEGAEWTDEHPDLYSVTRKAVDRALTNLWHDAQGDDLPKIDREVIVLCDDGHGSYKVAFAHRPYKKGYLGKSLVTGNVETFYPHTYGKGGWNIPDVRWWLDCNLPNMEE